MPGHTRLYRRGARYYHRAAIPVDIKDTYPKTEETFSLGTSDYAEALKLVRIKSVEVDRKFEAHRQQQLLQNQPALKELSDAQIEKISEVYYAFCLEEDEEIRLAGFYDEDEPLPENPVPSFEEYADLVEDMGSVDKSNFARGKTDDFYMGEVDEVLAWTNVNLRLSPTSPSRKKVARALQAASIKARKDIAQRNKGEVVPTPKLDVVQVAASVPYISQAVEDWASEKARTSWVPKTEREYRVWLGHFISVVGDRALDTYTKADARLFKLVLLKLPANWNKHEALKGLPIDKAAEKAAEIGLKPMSDRNFNKLIGFVSTFWRWAEDNLDGVPSNIFKGLKIKESKDVRDDRDPFTTKDLEAIFNAPIFTGCKSRRQWDQPGPYILRDTGLYWVPLISLFSGMRLGEIIQLYTADIREEENITYISVNSDGEDKHLKNANSRRDIPVHPMLIELGFLKYLEKQRLKGSQRLFPDLGKGEDGYYSSPFSKHFNRFLKSVGVKRDRITFHSFRHSFEDACCDSDVSKEIMDAIQGHGEDGMSRRYGKGYILRKKSEAMNCIRYRDLDLSHLGDKQAR